MQFYRCRCGNAQSYGSMPPDPCQGCEQCGTTLTQHPSLHAAPKPHEFTSQSVDTDAGAAVLSRCRWCGKRKPIEVAP